MMADGTMVSIRLPWCRRYRSDLCSTRRTLHQSTATKDDLRHAIRLLYNGMQ
jgi:hypothetical protein